MTDAILIKGDPAKSLSITAMLDAEDIQYVVVSVPEWGGEVRLGSVSAGDMIDELEVASIKGNREAMVRLVVRSLVNEDGSRVPVDQVEDLVTKFRKKDIRVMNRLAEAALKLNSVPLDREDSKNVSGETASVVSPIASQPPAAS
jgi:hypothetical protein